MLKFYTTLFMFSFIKMSFALSIASYNIRNFDYDQRSHGQTDKTELKKIITEIDSDLLAVQEIVKTEIFEKYITTHFSQYKAKLTSCGGHHGQKLGFIYNTSKLELLDFKQDLSTVNPSSTSSESIICELGSRPMAVALFKEKLTQRTFFAFSVHLKSGGTGSALNKRFRQLQKMKEAIKYYQKLFKTDKYILMGDFNTTEYLNETKPWRKRFQDFTFEIKSSDLSENIECSAYWWGGKRDGLLYPSHLDHIIVSDNLVHQTNSGASLLSHCQKLRCNIAPEKTMEQSYKNVSDHCPLKAEI